MWCVCGGGSTHARKIGKDGNGTRRGRKEKNKDNQNLLMQIMRLQKIKAILMSSCKMPNRNINSENIQQINIARHILKLNNLCLTYT